MKKVLILGSTGSIGTQTLEVIREFPKLFKVVGLTAKQNKKLLSEQCEIFSVQNSHLGEKGLADFVRKNDFDILVNALSGEIGTEPTREAIYKGKIIALANKETLVAHGETIMKEIKKYDATLRPIDSEHSAIWQCLRGEKIKEVKKIILTCSGGPFRSSEWTMEKLAKVKPKDALAHPNWNMGQKISIDSATLMNKALEVIEAVRLFGISPEQIEVVIHKESIMHSAVEFIDGSIIAQMGVPDMRTAIALALSAPTRLPLSFPKFNIFSSNLSFEKVDIKRFPSIDFAMRALAGGEKLCAKMNKVNEDAVQLFLNNKIGFLDIFKLVGDIF